jgi:catechol 2,3-dioxygenase-like lactoylglutathione lyase family enzyme
MVAARQVPPAMRDAAVPRSVASVAYLVRDYDEAIGFFTGALDFELLEDVPQSPSRRWVVVAPRGGQGCALVLARADTPAQQARVGDQAGGRVFLFLRTGDFRRDHARMQAHGVRFLEPPREEPYGTVAVFEDLYGNRWDLLQPAG